MVAWPQVSLRQAVTASVAGSFSGACMGPWMLTPLWQAISVHLQLVRPAQRAASAASWAARARRRRGSPGRACALG